MSATQAGSGLARPAQDSYRYDRFFANGRWSAAHGNEQMPVFDCALERRLGVARSASPDNVDAAVAAARAALPGWKARPAQERAHWLRALHAELGKRSDELASVISAEVGTAIRMSVAIQVASSLGLLDVTARLLTEERLEEQIGNSTVVQEPAGVVGAITPWNYPLFQTMGKVAAALAAGCTVVHKPSELAPVSAFALAEAVEMAGLPPGVYNLVPGTGPAVGEMLTAHPDVNMVSFTGSTRAGRRVYEASARSVKRVALELGGKSASVILDDAELERAVKSTVNRAFLNSGQTCDAWTRLLVPRARTAETLDLAIAHAQRLTVGDPFDEKTKLGPLISASQRANAAALVDEAVSQGATLAAGGSGRLPGWDRGHYFQPTILTDVTPDMHIAQAEVFGPVLSVMPYASDEEALAWANATSYGLSGAVWSADRERALRFARGMDAGQVVVNGGAFNPLAPFGGVKQSGLGRELGAYGIREFLTPKALQC